MKRLLILAVSFGLVTAGLGTPAAARRKAVKTTLYLHGNAPLGEIDGVSWLTEDYVMPMDTSKPAAGPPKSMGYSGVVFNDQCTGLPLVFPTWVGDLRGTIVGNATLTLHFLSAPSRIKARIWTDTPVFSCNDSFIEPAQEVEVQVPPGRNTVEVVFQKLKLKAGSSVMVELLSRSPSAQGRVLYDATGFESSLSFSCLPLKGNSCTSE